MVTAFPPSAQSFRFDGETDLDFAQARMHNFNLGRFTSPDPYNIIFEKNSGCSKSVIMKRLIRYLFQPQNWNRYIYVLGNPMIYVDPTGEIYLLHKDGYVSYFPDKEYYSNIDIDPEHYRNLGYQSVVENGSAVEVFEGATGIFEPFIGRTVILGEDGILTEIPSIGLAGEVTIHETDEDMPAPSRLDPLVVNVFEFAWDAQKRQFAGRDPFGSTDPYSGGYRHCVAACIAYRRFGNFGAMMVGAWDTVAEGSGANDSPGDMKAERMGLIIGFLGQASCELHCLVPYPN